MDFTEEKTLGLDIGADFTPLTDCCGYDQCYVIRDSGLRHAAWAVGPETGIRMEVLTTLPGVHLYTANFLAPVTAGKDGAHYAARDAVCFETEDFPDAPNHPNFPDTTLLPDKPYSSTTIYRLIGGDVKRRTMFALHPLHILATKEKSMSDYSSISFKNNGKLKLLIIVGTRPEIIRLAAVINKTRKLF